MESAGLLVRARHGVYQLTQEGEGLLSHAPEHIDINLLKEYPEFTEWSKRSNAPPPDKDVTQVRRDDISETPEEVLAYAAGQLGMALEAKPVFRNKMVKFNHDRRNCLHLRAHNAPLTLRLSLFFTDFFPVIMPSAMA